MPVYNEYNRENEMTEQQRETGLSRRDFLKETLRKTGYILPAVAVIHLKTADSWAENYGRQQGQQRVNGKDDPCNGFFEKIFNSRCWR